MAESPLVSVVMPVYNAEAYLKLSIESILNQSYTNFEFLIFNDASTDSTPQILESYSDERIRLFNKEKNQGYLGYLNQGIQLAKGKYILRADADDINRSDRIKKQVQFMEQNPGVGVCGSWIEIINAEGEYSHMQKYYLESDFIKAHLFWTCAFAHPSVIIRKDIMDQYALFYEANWYLAEDYHLWNRMARICLLANLPEALVKVRKHGYNISVIRAYKQIQLTKSIRLNQLNRLEIRPTEEEWHLHMQLLEGVGQVDLDFIKKAGAWLEKLQLLNQQIGAFPKLAFEKILQEHWYKHTLGYTRLGLGLRKVFIKSPLSEYKNFSFSFKIKFFLKALLKI